MNTRLTLVSPIFIAITWVLLNLNEHLGFIGFLVVLTFLSINLLNLKNYKQDKKLSIISTIFLVGFFILSFQNIWAEHYAPPPKGFEETRGLHKHNFWNSIFMHMH